jgi:hypothetical protein
MPCLARVQKLQREGAVHVIGRLAGVAIDLLRAQVPDHAHFNPPVGVKMSELEIEDICSRLFFEQVRRVGDRRVCPHCCGDYGRFRQHCVICSSLTRRFHMQLNTVRTLRCQRDGYRDQLLVQDINGTGFERLLIKRPEGFHRIWYILIELLEPSEILHIKHVSDSILVLYKALLT